MNDDMPPHFPPAILQDNPLENLNLAFDVAEKYLDIPRMLDAEGKEPHSDPQTTQLPRQQLVVHAKCLTVSLHWNVILYNKLK